MTLVSQGGHVHPLVNTYVGSNPAVATKIKRRNMEDYKNVVDTDELIDFAIGNAKVSEKLGKEATSEVINDIFDNSIFWNIYGPILGLIYQDYDTVRRDDRDYDYDLSDSWDCLYLIICIFMEEKDVKEIWIKSDSCDC